jgi:hypothetical protein
MQPRHQQALRQALEWLPTVAQPLGIVASGSIVRGNPHPASDLDIVILHGGAWRRRVQHWFNDTPAELFFNSEAWLRSVIDSEAAQGRPVMAHMLATGMLLHDTGDRMAAIINHARAVLERGPCLNADALLRDRYAAANLVEDALDFAAAPEPDALLARAAAVEALVRHAYLSTNLFLPRTKERLALLPDRGLAELLATALAAPPATANDALRHASEQVLGVAGFFEWDSGSDHSTPK